MKQIFNKLGHELWHVVSNEISKLPKNTMVVGVDVSHENPAVNIYGRPEKMKSTVGFCATYDEFYSNCNSFMYRQERGEEYVKESNELMKQALEGYKAQNKVFPSAVLVYRDG